MPNNTASAGAANAAPDVMEDALDLHNSAIRAQIRRYRGYEE
eukprot:gene5742-51866_t